MHRILGEDHPDTLMRKRIPAGWLTMNGDANGGLERAEVMYREILRSMETVLGYAHPYTLLTVTNFAFNLRKQGKPAESEVYCLRALEGQRDFENGEHWGFAMAGIQAFIVLATQGKLWRSTSFMLVISGVYMFVRLLTVQALSEVVHSILTGRDLWPRSSAKSSHAMSMCLFGACAFLIFLGLPIIVSALALSSARGKDTVIEVTLMVAILPAFFLTLPLRLVDFFIQGVASVISIVSGRVLPTNKVFEK